VLKASLDSMLRLLDARSGSYAEVRPTRLGLLRVFAQVPGAAAAPDITGLRVLLLADLLVRTAELRHLQVLTVVAAGEQAPSWLEALERTATALGIHPPSAHASSREVQSTPSGPIDVYLASSDAGTDGGLSGVVTCVGAARIHRTGDATRELLTGYEAEPLAVRLALLYFQYHQPADLTEDMLAQARATVGHWRLQVAEWAKSPSRPVPAQLAETIRSAFDDLDTVAVLALLQGLASDPDQPPGAKFETFLYADRILGLDLPRDIGRT
jgi:hypothetical protein